MSDFTKRLIAWQRRHGRHDLPWQGTRDAYRVWLSEIMLQQTQVATVVPYYERFVARFPDVASLARARLDEVLRLWAGLGYYSRARNLHRAARAIVRDFHGSFPRERRALEALPGVGRSTAAAIAALAFGASAPILDGNVKRVLARHFAVRGFPGQRAVEIRLWSLAETLMPARGVGAYTQALMDLGATVCKRSSPACEACPLNRSCIARARNRIAAYPQPRPRKALPLRDTTMLLLVHEGEALLEQRPPAGLWGGLWSLPEMPVGADARAHCAAKLGCDVGAAFALEPLRHGFTHFRLDIRPVLCEVRRVRPRAAQPGTAWLALEDAMRAAVPAPVKKLLARMVENPPG